MHQSSEKEENEIAIHGTVVSSFCLGSSFQVIIIVMVILVKMAWAFHAIYSLMICTTGCQLLRGQTKKESTFVICIMFQSRHLLLPIALIHDDQTCKTRKKDDLVTPSASQPIWECEMPLSRSVSSVHDKASYPTRNVVRFDL